MPDMGVASANNKAWIVTGFPMPRGISLRSGLLRAREMRYSPCVRRLALGYERGWRAVSSRDRGDEALTYWI